MLAEFFRRCRTFLVLLVLFIGLTVYFNQIELNKTSPLRLDQQARTLLDLDTDALRRITIESAEEAVLLEKGEERWTVDGLYYASPEIIEGIKQHSLVIAQRKLSGEALDGFDYGEAGLDPPQMRVTFETESASETLFYGNPIPIGLGYYAQKSGAPEVYLIAPWLFTQLNLPVESFRDPLLWRGAEPESIALSTPGGHWSLVKDPEWIVASERFSDWADPNAVREWLTALADLRVARYWPSSSEIPESALITIRLGDADDTTLYLGPELPEDASLLYARNSTYPFGFVVAKESVDALNRKPEHFIAKKCFQFFQAAVQEIRIAYGESEAAFEKTDNGTWLTAQTASAADAVTIRELLHTIDDLRFSERPEQPPEARPETPVGFIELKPERTDRKQRLTIYREDGAWIGLLEHRGLWVRLPDSVEHALLYSLEEPAEAP